MTTQYERTRELLAGQEKMGINFPIPLVSPITHEPLDPDSTHPDCPDCVKHFKRIDGFPDLIVGDRFNDQMSGEQIAYEEQTNSDLTHNYWLPLFEQYWPHRVSYAPKLLSLGCGTGVDVDLLTDEGFNCVGIEIGNRCRIWRRRKHPERLLLANGAHLPFADNTFDCVYCGCVFPHVGVVGDSDVVTGDYYETRLKLAAEMSRVLKADGKIVVSSPNRNFPFDLFHGREPGRYKPRSNLHRNPSLLSVSDYRRLFRDGGCHTATPLPSKNYWGFLRSKRSLKGWLLGMPIRFLFWLTSICAVLRGSIVDPWLVVQVEK